MRKPMARLAVAYLLLNFSTAFAAGEGRITGTVMRDPVRPVQRPGDPAALPFSTKIMVLDAQGREVRTVTSDQDGVFNLTLPPGDYTLHPAGGLPKMSRGFPVKVEADKTAKIQLSIDTGMR